MAKLKYTNEENLKRLIALFTSITKGYNSSFTQLDVTTIMPNIYNLTPFSILESIMSTQINYYSFKNILSGDKNFIEYNEEHRYFTELTLIYLLELDLISVEEKDNTLELDIELKLQVIIDLINKKL